MTDKRAREIIIKTLAVVPWILFAVLATMFSKIAGFIVLVVAGGVGVFVIALLYVSFVVWLIDKDPNKGEVSKSRIPYRKEDEWVS